MLDTGVLSSPQPVNPARLAAALLPAMCENAPDLGTARLSGSPTTRRPAGVDSAQL